MRIFSTAILASFFSMQTSAQADTAVLARHLRAFVHTKGFRNYTNIPALDSVAAYIKSVFADYAVTA